MAYTKVSYERINWVNKKTAKTTPIGATNLNIMDKAISELSVNQDSIYQAVSELTENQASINEDLENVKKKYQAVLDDIYNAIVSRGLVFEKDDITAYADKIRQLKKLDVELALTDVIGSEVSVTDSVDAVADMADSTTTWLGIPEKAVLTDYLDSDNLTVAIDGDVTINDDLAISLDVTTS